MNNPYYNPTGAPTRGSPGASAVIDAEFRLIAAGFDAIPSALGNGTAAPTTGQIVQIPDFQEFTSIVPLGTLAALTVELPLDFRSGSTTEFIITQAITSLTILPVGGLLISGTAIAATASRAGLVLAYRLQGVTWYRTK